MKKIFSDISKTEDLDDGTLKVYGVASTGKKDTEGETITPEAMKAALPGYMAWGAVREMHDATSAAGTAIEASVDENGVTQFAAHIVDAEAIKKVKAGVYKGFSLGGNATSRDPLNKSIITGLNLVEISLADRPVDPGAVISFYKAEGIGDVKKSMWDVSKFAQLLSDLSYVAESLEWDLLHEKDSSPLPEQFRAWLTTGVDLFKAVSAEEAQEMLDRLQAIADSDKTEKAAKAGDIQKAGAKFSAATKAALKSAQEALAAASKALEEIGYDAEDADEMGKAAKATDSDEIRKAVGAMKIELADAQKERDEAIAKAATASQKLAEALAAPATPKASLIGTPITKSQDAGNVLGGFAPILNQDGSINQAATLIKAAQSGILK